MFGITPEILETILTIIKLSLQELREWMLFVTESCKLSALAYLI